MPDETTTVAALAEALGYAGVERGYVGGDVFRQAVARRLLASPALADLIAAAEQRGREDNADHGMCYVHGSRALGELLREERARALREAADALVDEFRNDGFPADWLRDRADREADQ